MDEVMIETEKLVDRLRKLGPGRGLVVREKAGHGKSEVGLCVRDSTTRIGTLGVSPKIGIRASILEQKLPVEPPVTVAMASMILLLGPPTLDSLFEISIDVCEPKNEGVFESLALQPRLPIYLHGDDFSRVRTLSVPNGLRSFAETVAARRKSISPWSPEHFQMAEEAIAEQFVDTMALWVRLGNSD